MRYWITTFANLATWLLLRNTERVWEWRAALILLGVGAILELIIHGIATEDDRQQRNAKLREYTDDDPELVEDLHWRIFDGPLIRRMDQVPPVLRIAALVIRAVSILLLFSAIVFKLL